MSPRKRPREEEEAIRCGGGRSSAGGSVEPDEHEGPPGEPASEVDAIFVGMPVDEEEYRELKERAERPENESDESSSEKARRHTDDSTEE